MKKTIIALSLLTISLNSFSQETSPEVKEIAQNKPLHFVGIQAGTATGVGFSYKLISNNFGVQVTGIPIFSEDSFWSSAGLTLTYRFGPKNFMEEPIRFLIYAAANHLYNKSSYEDYYLNGSSYTITDIDQQVNTALGFGVEYTSLERFNFNVMAGYGLYLDGNFKTNLSVEAGVHYRIGK